MHKIKRISMLGCGLTALAISVSANAQDVEAGMGDPVNTASEQQSAVAETYVDTQNEIVVRAQRGNSTLQETSATVDVVTADDIADLNIFDIKEISNLAPGLDLNNNDGRSAVATLRGVTYEPDSGSSPAVEVFLNEIPSDSNTIFSAIYDIGQIEVVRGPQGLFRGRTSPAGAILIQTARPDLDEPTGYVQFTGTDQNAINAQGAASLPIIPGKLAMRAALLYNESDVSGVKNVDGRKSYSETMSGRLSLAFDNDEGFRADLMYYHLDADNRPFVAVFGPGNGTSNPQFSPSDRRSVTEGEFRFRNNTDFVTLNASYDLGDMELSFNGGYQDSILRQRRDQDTANAVDGYLAPQELDILYEYWNAEVRLASTGDGPFNWQVSANHTDYTSEVPLTQQQDLFFGPPGVPTFVGTAAVDILIENKNYGLAGLVSYEFADAVTITAGLRHTWDDVDRVQDTVLSYPGGAPVGPGGAFVTEASTTDETTQKSRAFTGGANINWEVNRDLNVYASYGRSFRPGPNAVGVTFPLDDELVSLDDETSDGFEVGAKFQFLDDRASVNLSAFYQKFDNYISYNPAVVTDSDRDGTVDPVTSPLPSSGDAIAKGVEMQASFRPNRNIDLGLNAAYQDSHYDDATIICNDFDGDGEPDSDGAQSVQPGRQVSVCQTDERLAQLPKFTISGTAEVRFPMGSVEPFVRTLVNHRPGFDSELDDYNYRSFTKWDMFLGVRDPDGAWEVLGFVKNLLGQDRVLRSSSGNFQFGNLDSGYRFGRVTDPREFGITTKFSW